MRRRLAIESLGQRRTLASDLTIYAAGEVGSESMQLIIDGHAAKNWSNVGGEPWARQFLPFTFHSPESINIDQFRIAFTNDDLVNGTLDRNLYVDKIMLDGVVYQTESPTVFSTGTWLPTDGIQPGYRRSEVLHADGYFQYATGLGSLVEIYAAGTSGQENMSLVIEGSTANDWTAVGGAANGRQFSRFAYRAAELVTANQVQVWFINDVYAPPIDYDLRVDRLVIDGVTYQTEADTTYSTGTYVPDNGLVLPGFWELEWLNSKGYFE